MLVGTVEIELYLPGVLSLKEKRFVMKSIKQRIRNQFNVSIAEVDYNDKWQRAGLGIACVSNDRRFIDSTLTKIMNFIQNEDRVEVINHNTEIL